MTTAAPHPTVAGRWGRRFVQLHAGLVIMGVSVALFVRAELGLVPWDVLHQGLSERTGLAIGTCTIITSVSVLILWVPLRQRPGIGTLLNAVIVGLVLNAVLGVTPSPDHIVARGVELAAAIVLYAVATSMYIGAGLGPGPRDGLMTGLAARGLSLRVVRTGIELAALAGGWLLGGTVGIGTLAFALGIGPLVHLLLPFFTVATGAKKDRHSLGPAREKRSQHAGPTGRHNQRTGKAAGHEEKE